MIILSVFTWQQGCKTVVTRWRGCELICLMRRPTWLNPLPLWLPTTHLIQWWEITAIVALYRVGKWLHECHFQFRKRISTTVDKRIKHKLLHDSEIFIKCQKRKVPIFCFSLGFKTQGLLFRDLKQKQLYVPLLLPHVHHDISCFRLPSTVLTHTLRYDRDTVDDNLLMVLFPCTNKWLKTPTYYK